MEERDFEREFLLHFHGINYIITLTMVDGAMIRIEAEQEDTNERWTGDFTCQYLEEITQKTGNYKKFAVFVKMLMTALARESETVFIDLLTFSDLEMLKARKTGQPLVNSSLSSNPKSHLKRYLILTYTVEFDRVHYPLPLMYEETPSVEALKRTIRRLRKELETVRNGEGGGSDTKEREKELKQIILQLRQENTQIRHKLGQLESRTTDEVAHDSFPNVTDNYKRQYERTKKELSEARRSYEKLQAEMGREIHRLKEVVKAAEPLAPRGKDQPRAYRRRVEELEAELQRERAKSKREVASLKRELAGVQQRVENKRQGNHTLFSGHPAHRRLPASRSRHSSPRSGHSARSQSPTASSLGKRFDPTAYQLEKENRMRNRKLLHSPSADRHRRGGKRESGYSSQGSAHSLGYSSAGSKKSHRTTGSNASGGSQRSRRSTHSITRTSEGASQRSTAKLHASKTGTRKKKRSGEGRPPAPLTTSAPRNYQKSKPTMPDQAHNFSSTVGLTHAWRMSSPDLLVETPNEADDFEISPKQPNMDLVQKQSEQDIEHRQRTTDHQHQQQQVQQPLRPDSTTRQFAIATQSHSIACADDADTDTQAEITDIDKRIHALQSFLDKARTHILADLGQTQSEDR